MSEPTSKDKDTNDKNDKAEKQNPAAADGELTPEQTESVAGGAGYIKFDGIDGEILHRKNLRGEG